MGEQAKAWTSYLTRSSYMLQQGKFVADILYYYGEDNNITSLFGKKLPSIPEGYNYDFVNADALINLLSVKDGRIITPSGMSYRVLVLDSNARKMSLPVLRKIGELVKAGAVVTGIKPEGTPSLSDDKAVYSRLLNEVWGSSNARVYTGKALEEVLKEIKVEPDFTYTRPQANTRLMFVHRKLADGDIYWVNNRNGRNEKLEATFRVTGRVPHIWHPETGKTEAASYTISNGVTKVELSLVPDDAVFVVFKNKATANSVSRPVLIEKELATMNGDWAISFQKDRGAPESVSVNELKSWTTHPDAGVKYFSGTATYTRNVTVPADWLKKGTSLWMELGEVKNIAEVIVNGKSLGITWKKPFRVDLTGALKPGVNKLEIKVTNLWVNRLIGDQQPGVANKITYTSMPFHDAKAALLPSGLLGPVRIMSIK